MKQNRILALLLALLLALSTFAVAEEIVDTEWTVVEEGEAVEEALPVEEEEVEAKSKFDDFTIENGTLSAYNGTDTNVVIDAKWGVTNIGSYAFEDSNIVSVTIPATVTEIGYEAFRNCSALKTVKLNKGLQVIDDGAFQFCTALTSITLPATLTDIGMYAFEGTGLKSVKIPADVGVICDGAFKKCGNLASVTLGKNTKVIESEAFNGCTKLSSIKFNDEMEDIGEAAFAGCTGLKTVKFGSYVAYRIGPSAFAGCTNLTSLTLPTYCEEIGYDAFMGCASLKAIQLPLNLEIVESDTFNGCTALKSVKAGEYVDRFREGAFEGCPDAMTWEVYVGTPAEEYAKDQGYTVNYRKDYNFFAEQKSIEIMIGDGFDIYYFVLAPWPERAKIEYKTSNAKVLEKVEDDVFKAKAEGTANVTATCTIPDPNNEKKSLFKKSVTMKVKVIDPYKLLSVEINNDPKFTIDIDQEMNLNTIPHPDSADELTTTWKSSKPKAATVEETTGLLKGVAEGTATITATVQQPKNKIKKTASVKVTVVDPKKLTGLSINNGTTWEMTVGETNCVEAMTVPVTAEEVIITYKSSNAKVASVDTESGMVEALKKGSATITATGVQGKIKKTATVKITVKE